MEQYFKLHNIPASAMVDIASLHLNQNLIDGINGGCMTSKGKCLVGKNLVMN